MHQETRSTAISQEVKSAVDMRDRGRCILCGSYNGVPNAHVVRRSQGGMGIEKNIVTLCPDCHREFDEGKCREALYVHIVNYLKGFYPDWSKADMVYRRWL